MMNLNALPENEKLIKDRKHIRKNKLSLNIISVLQRHLVTIFLGLSIMQGQRS